MQTHPIVPSPPRRLLNIAGIIVSVVLLLGANAGNAILGFGDPPTIAERQEKLLQAREDAIAHLEAEFPQTNDILTESKGYAIFSNFGMNLGLISTQRGGGILRDNRTGEDTYMKMFSAGGGFGLGIKDYIAVFVFHTDAAMEQFVSEGWDFSGQADAKVDDGMANKEGAELAITAMPGTSLYQITNKGVSAQVTLQGTKFWKDEELN